MMMPALSKLNKPTLFGPAVSLGEEVIHVLVVVPDLQGVGNSPKRQRIDVDV